MNPFSAQFHKVDDAVFAKQQYESDLIWSVFDAAPNKSPTAEAVAGSEAKRGQLAEAVREAFVPVTHLITITKTPA